MWANLVLVNAPEGRLRVTTRLEPGKLGDSLDQALRTSVLRHPVLAGLLRVSRVALDGRDLVPGHDVYSYFLILGGERVFTPTLQVWGVWRSEGGDELMRADEAVDSKFSDRPLDAPVTLCRDDMRGQSRISATDPPKAILDVAASELRPEKLRVYFTSALVEGFRNGDADYISALVQSLRSLDVDARRLIGPQDIPEDQQPLLASGHLQVLDYGLLVGDDRATQARKDWGAILGYLLAERERDAELVQVLHLQTRYPASGNAFNREAIEAIRGEGFHVVVTIHEYVYNYRNPSDPVNNVFILDQYCDVSSAERVVFLNQKDRERAIADQRARRVVTEPKFGSELVGTVSSSGLQKVSRHIPVAITVRARPIRAPEILGRPPNVLLFGMIRAGKGDRAAIELAKAFNQRSLPHRVVVAGLPTDEPTMKNLMEQAFGMDCVWRVVDKGAWKKTPFGDLFHRRAWGELRAMITACTDCRGVAEGEAEAARREAERDRDELLPRYEELIARVEALRETVSQEPKRKKGQSPSAERQELNQLQRELGLFQKRLDPPRPPGLPIDLFVDVTAAELSELFQRCRYAYKQDEKGMADNASSIISCVANGCITFTSQGAVTPIEFQQGTRIADFEAFIQQIPRGLDFEGGVVFRDDRVMISFDYAGLLREAVVMPPDPEVPADPEFVVTEIRRRAEDGALDRATIDAMARLTEHRYEPEIIAIEHLILYQEFLLERYRSTQL
jgi:hypothetical protein